jgi:hypothetical protein
MLGYSRLLPPGAGDRGHLSGNGKNALADSIFMPVSREVTDDYFRGLLVGAITGMLRMLNRSFNGGAKAARISV